MNEQKRRFIRANECSEMNKMKCIAAMQSMHNSLTHQIGLKSAGNPTAGSELHACMHVYCNDIQTFMNACQLCICACHVVIERVPCEIDIGRVFVRGDVTRSKLCEIIVAQRKSTLHRILRTHNHNDTHCNSSHQCAPIVVNTGCISQNLGF